MAPPPFFLFSDTFMRLVHDDPLVFVDVGARGRLPDPWGRATDRIRVIGFEPDAAECKRLQEGAPEGWRFHPMAVWKDEDGVRLHLARSPAVSSVHPPNMEYLQNRYPSPIWAHREPARILEVPSITLDSVLEGDGAMFVKLDTQGSEQEILEGAERALRENVYAVLAETWTVPFHKGQLLTGDLLTFMAARGYAPYGFEVGGACPPRLEGAEPPGRRQLVQVDVLFLRHDPEWAATVRLIDAVKAAAIAELYGYAAEARYLMERRLAAHPEDKGTVRSVIEGLERAARLRRRLPRRARLFVQRVQNWGVTDEYAPLR